MIGFPMAAAIPTVEGTKIEANTWEGERMRRRGETVNLIFFAVEVALVAAGMAFCAAAGLAQVPGLPQDATLSTGWELASADHVNAAGTAISQESYKAGGWLPIHHMPATVLEILQEDKVYPHLYYGMRLLKDVPQDLYKKDWWYRTEFSAPAGAGQYWLDLPGINYRADLWINGKEVANSSEIVGMYVDHRLNVTRFVRPGAENVLAIKVTPERAIQNFDGVELADSWFDWINWKYLGYHGPLNPHDLYGGHLKAEYRAPDHTGKQGTVSPEVHLAAQLSTHLLLRATVMAGRQPVKGGEVVFLNGSKVIGTAPVKPGGSAELTVKNFAGISFVPDRNAGVWKPVHLYATGPVKVWDAYVETRLPLPQLSPASLSIYADLENGSSQPVHGEIEAEITRPGKPVVRVRKPISLAGGETREVSLTPGDFPQLLVDHPDLWWPYTLGKPALYHLHFKVLTGGRVSDTDSIQFGIRQVTQHRDQDQQFPKVGKGGYFYLTVNGKDFLIRGADYSPDLLYKYDPKREAEEISYVKDMGLNMLRWESKISSEHMYALADRAGVPVMVGWMCCNQWEMWKQWDAEDYRVAWNSLRSQIRMLRSHPSAFIWANGSDGLPPKPVLAKYHQILHELHWQDAVVDTVSSFARDKDGNPVWDGIQMQGPYSWRPPSYWFSGRYAPAQGSCAEQGDNENVPPIQSLRKFIPPDKLWPINQYWSFHAGSNQRNSQLLNTREALNRRYGPSSSAAEFSEKAQLGLYEDTRAQFEDFAANGWTTHKMTMYWMLDDPWPSFFGHLFDYYLKPGGAYYGAKKGLRPVSVVFDYYAAGDHSKANIKVVDQTLQSRSHLSVRVRIYDLEGRVRLDRKIQDLSVPAQGVMLAMMIPRLKDISPDYFVRCQLFDARGKQIVDNVYWQSTILDDVGPASNDDAFYLHQVSWANFKPLETMPKTPLQMRGTLNRDGSKDKVTIDLRNPSSHIAFFERVAVTKGKDGQEVLPILYSDNYITVFPGETETVTASFDPGLLGGQKPWLRVKGYDTPKEISALP